MEMEKILRLMADMNSMAPAKDKLATLIADTMAEDEDELDMDDLDLLYAARKDEVFRKDPNSRR